MRTGINVIAAVISLFPLVLAIGFNNHIDHDPIPCGPIETFETGTYLRDVYVSDRL